MRAYLHLKTVNSENSVMWQILPNDVELKEGDIFNYTDEHLNQLDKEERKNFDMSGLSKGAYLVETVQFEPNDEWGDLRILFIRQQSK